MSTIQTSTTIVFSNPAHVDQHIALSPSTRIVTLLHNGTILAQHRLSKKQFRLLALLLQLPGGALHAELLAVLGSTDARIERVLVAKDEQAVALLMQPDVAQWQAHLQQVARMSLRDKRRELAVLRRSLTGQRGLNTILKEFGVVALPVYKQGYLLCPLQQTHKRPRS